jgi:hypothetical protein
MIGETLTRELEIEEKIRHVQIYLLFSLAFIRSSIPPEDYPHENTNFSSQNAARVQGYSRQTAWSPFVPKYGKAYSDWRDVLADFSRVITNRQSK